MGGLASLRSHSILERVLIFFFPLEEHLAFESFLSTVEMIKLDIADIRHALQNFVVADR